VSESSRRGGLRGRPARLLLVLLLACAGPASAHKLLMFAAADGAHIDGEVFFAGGGKAAGVPVSVTDAAGKVLAELRSGPDGRFSYTAEAPTAHHLVAMTPDGHRAEWRVGAEELAAALPAAAAEEAPAALADDQGAVGADAAEKAGAPAEPTLDPALLAAIEQAVAHQVRPLREEAAAARHAAGFRDVLGGIGYIVGLAGLGLWWQSRKSAGR
jgi:nickel transport protein